jgi:DNA-binding NarL/FixJ family response regulator
MTVSGRAPSIPLPYRLVIVDDHDFVRAGIKVMLAGEPDMEIVGEAEDGQEALALVGRERPDLALMDVRMPGMDGLATTRSIKRSYPRVSVLILTMHENEDYLLEAIRSGAAGYVLKDAPQNELVTAIRKVLEGETALNRKLATGLLQRLANDIHGNTMFRRRSGVEHPAQPLTPRELEVLEHVALGSTNREIAEHFVISVGTVKNHVEHIIAKLGASDRTQAVVQALELGLIGFPER